MTASFHILWNWLQAASEVSLLELIKATLNIPLPCLTRSRPSGTPTDYRQFIPSTTRNGQSWFWLNFILENLTGKISSCFTFHLDWTILTTSWRKSTNTIFFPWRYSPNLGLGLPPWNSPFNFGFLDLRHSVGLLGRAINSSQGLSTFTQTQKNVHTYTNTLHPCPEWGSKPRSRLPSERRQCMPHTARLPWPAQILF
jgi:hypothetical protein